MGLSLALSLSNCYILNSISLVGDLLRPLVLFFIHYRLRFIQISRAHSEFCLFNRNYLCFRLKYQAFLAAIPVWNYVVDDDPSADMKLLKNVWQPPKKKCCIHQSRGVLDCPCPDALPPEGYNLRVYNGKNSKNKWIHLTIRFHRLIEMHTDITYVLKSLGNIIFFLILIFQ